MLNQVFQDRALLTYCPLGANYTHRQGKGEGREVKACEFIVPSISLTHSGCRLVTLQCPEHSVTGMRPLALPSPLWFCMQVGLSQT